MCTYVQLSTPVFYLIWMNSNSSVGNEWSEPYTDPLSGQKYSFPQMLRGLTIGNASMARSESSAKSKRELCQ